MRKRSDEGLSTSSLIVSVIFSGKSFVQKLGHHLHTETSTTAIGATFCLLLR